MNLIEKLDQMEALRWYDAGQGPKSGYSPCDDIRFHEELVKAWPLIRAALHQAQMAYPGIGSLFGDGRGMRAAFAELGIKLGEDV